MPRDLPPELLLAIGRATRTTDLPSLLLINTFYNHFFTGTLLYSSIELRDFKSTRRCLRTLCKAPTDCAFGRDLASLVCSFHAADFPYTRIRGKSFKTLQNMFARVLPRLINVQVFSTQLVRQLPLRALMELLQACPSTLHLLDISCTGTCRSDDDLQLISQELPSLPQLTSIKLVGIHEKHPVYIQFLQRLSYTVANHIHTLHLDMLNNEPEIAMLSAARTFPVLQELKIEGRTFFLPEFPHAAFPHLRTLILRGERFFWQLPSYLAPGPGATQYITHYPELETLCCCARAIPSLFPPDITSRDVSRALHTVELDNPAYILPTPYVDYVPVTAEEVSTALILLKRSALPIRHLCVSAALLGGAAEEPDFEEVLPMDMEGLETLVVVMGEDWCTQETAMRVVSRMISRMPLLRSLAFADLPRKNRIPVARPDIAQVHASQGRLVHGWSQYRSPLRSVSLTAGTEWVRRGAEWVLLEHPQEYAILGDDKNVDDEDDDDESGNHEGRAN